jgi:hypothetical protein
VVFRGCPLWTGKDRCEWHACGTASEDNPRTPWRRWLRLDRRVRPVLGDHRLVGKSPEDSRQLYRSRRVADASGAPVLRDQGPIGRPGTARPILALILACRTARRLPRLPGLPDCRVDCGL